MLETLNAQLEDELKSMYAEYQNKADQFQKEQATMSQAMQQTKLQDLQMLSRAMMVTSVPAAMLCPSSVMAFHSSPSTLTRPSCLVWSISSVTMPRVPHNNVLNPPYRR